MIWVTECQAFLTYGRWVYVHHGSRRPPSVPALAAALGATALLSGCSGQGWQSAAESSSAAPTTASPTTAQGTATASSTPGSTTRSAASSRTAAVNTDSVQTDPPVTAVDSAVVMTYAGWSTTGGVLEGSAFAQGHVDADATCVLTASRGGAAAVTGTPTPATPGPSSTDCGPLTLRLPSSASGSWKVSVVYAVGGTRLTSNSTEVQVP